MDPTLVYLAASLMIGLAGLGASLGVGILGVGILGSKLLEGCARQPELAPALQARFYLAMGTVDVVPMIALSMGLYLIFGVATGN